MKRIILSILLILTLALNAGSAMASFSTADAVIDWSAISNYLSSLSSIGTWEVKESFVETSLDGVNYPSQFRDDFENLFQTDFNANADVLANTFGGKEGAFANVGDTGYGYAYGDIYGEFTPSQDFNWTISFDYELFGEVEGGDFAFSDSYIFLMVGDQVYQDSLTLSGIGANTKTGRATVTAFLEAGETYTVAVGAGAEASTVPVPGAVWLLGSGLMALVGVRRKLTK